MGHIAANKDDLLKRVKRIAVAGLIVNIISALLPGHGHSHDHDHHHGHAHLSDIQASSPSTP